MKKRTLSLLLALVLLLSFVPIQTMAESNENSKQEINAQLPEKQILDAKLLLTPMAESVSTGASTKADIVFVIDSTGSMSDEISNVKNNLNAFTQVLDSAGLDFRIAVIEYKDIVEDGNDSTKVLSSGGNTWFTTAAQVQSVLSGISADGGGDTPETVLDALGCTMNQSFRENASKFAFLLTDADYKVDNNYGYADMASTVTALKSKGISVSVISSNSYQTTYNSLYTDTDGIFCNIYGNFSEELVKLAEYIKKVVKPVDIQLGTSIGDRSGSVWNCWLTATISATDEENATTGLSVTLVLPEGVTTPSALTCTIDELLPKGSGSKSTETLVWGVEVPVTSENANYTWSVKVTSKDFATGVICTAQDTFSTVGTEAVNYNWIWGEDNYSFLNTYGSNGIFGLLATPGFGTGPYYISDEDLKAFVQELSTSDLQNVAVNNASNTNTKDPVQKKVERFLNNDLMTWRGSCYGMSLTAALFKVGILSPKSWGGSTTYDIPALGASTNSALESMINIYHISQSTSAAVASRRYKIGAPQFPETIKTMWNMATQIGAAGSLQQPYLVRLASSDGGHAVVCFGAEKGSFSYNGKSYSKRLLIADPNKSATTHIYITDSFDNAVYTGGGYNEFGYRMSSLSELNSFNYADLKKNYKARLSVNSATEVRTSSGSALIIANQVVSTSGDFEYEVYDIENELSDGANTIGNAMILLCSDADEYIFEPQNSSELDFTLYYDDYSAHVQGDMNSVSLTPDGEVSIDEADGDIMIELAVNAPGFDFVSIEGEANGDVAVNLGDELTVSGEISDFTVENMNKNAEKQLTKIDGDADAKLTMDGDTLTGVIDSDGDGVFETPITVHSEHTYAYHDNGNGTHTATCTFGDDSFTEEHTYKNNVCEKCGASRSSGTHYKPESSKFDIEISPIPSNGSIEVSKKSASVGTDITITTTPDKGFVLETLTVLDKNGKEVEVKDIGSNIYSFTMPNGRVTISATFAEDNSILNFFVDVKATDYFYDAVLWAAKNGITKGTDAVHFSPTAPVTRGQAVTFLWRAAGSPEPAGDVSKFVDVLTNEYYAKAVAWAVEQGITNGVSDIEFCPNATCTRGQIVTFLARFAGVKDAETKSVFTDVKTDDYFAAAVKWARDNKVTEGITETAFEPYTNCTRAQMVTFLYRYFSD